MCELPDPEPVNVTARPDAMCSFLVNNWNWFSSITFANTVLGNISVVTPRVFVVAPIETAVAATPTNVLAGM